MGEGRGNRMKISGDLWFDGRLIIGILSQVKKRVEQIWNIRQQKLVFTLLFFSKFIILKDFIFNPFSLSALLSCRALLPNIFTFSHFNILVCVFVFLSLFAFVFEFSTSTHFLLGRCPQCSPPTYCRFAPHTSKINTELGAKINNKELQIKINTEENPKMNNKDE